jgi:hypothetical protein
MPGLAGETVPRGAIVYMSAVDGLWYLADSDALTTLPAVGVVADAGTAGNVIQILVIGIIERSDWTWTRGDPLYVSGAAGIMTQTAPATSKQVVAVALTATLIYVNPGGAGLDMSMLDYEVQTGIIAEPTVASKGNGHTVVVHNETEERDFIWARTDLDTKWSGVELL